ncbi:hypothetical protein C8R21_12035 [Nitrosospira multiformis]|uniref:Uncharacterized protein n=1 Tax=Nitrosospira multiformis TaxID=1231 RepID=A0A2T5I844_9PROT|nr:hypothetical protein [Nitrosospira multiformis]PTQ79996.1 hypothetical protein C8R21_12035 [Nitrosospira multiformis]
MANYIVTSGRSAVYPAIHHGGHFIGNRATFFLDKDFTNPDSNALAIPNLPIKLLSTSPVSVSDRFFGMHVYKRSNDIATDASFYTVRSHDMAGGKARWQKIEPYDNVWDFSDLDDWVNIHHAAGRDILFTLYGTPQWASARPNEQGAYGPYNLGLQAEPADMSRWDRFCSKIAERYKGKIKYYEVWNEPNYYNDGTGLTAEGLSNKAFFFSGTFAKLAEMTRRANQAIKAVDPTAKIISPALTVWSATAGSSAETYFLGMMAAPTGDGSTTMKDWIDIVGVHLYIGGNDITKLPGMIDRIDAAKATAGIAGKETWDTESAPISPDIALMSGTAGDLFIGRSLLIQAAKGIARTIYYQYDIASMGIKDRSVVTYRNRICNLLQSGEILSACIFTDGRVGYYTRTGLKTI